MADITTAVIQAAANTTTGTQSFTSSGFGTPKLALFFASYATVNGTNVDNATMFVGATDGTTHFTIAATDEDNQSTSDCHRRGTTDECIQLTSTAGGINGEANFSQWVTDGVEVNWAVAPASARLVTCVLMGGDDLTVDIGTFLANLPDGGTTAVTAPGFEPDVVIFIGNGNDFNDAISTTSPTNFGFAENRATIKNRALSNVARDGRSTTELTGGFYENLCQANMFGGALSRGFYVSSFDANGFTVTLDVGIHSSGLTSGYIALKFGGGDYWIGTVDSPTSTGNDSETGPGFKPQFVMQVLSTLQNTGPDYGTESENFGVHVFTADDEYSVTRSSEDGAGTTDTKSLTNSKLDMEDHTGTTLFDASFVSMDTNGWTLNFATTQGTATKWIALAIEESADNTGAIAEELRVGETFVASQQVTSSITEELRVGDSHSGVASATGAITEESRLGDTEASTAEAVGNVSEETRLGDSTNSTAEANASITEEARLGDSTSGTAEAIGVVSEEVRLGETKASTAAFVSSIAEELRLGDTETVVATAIASISEELRLGDTATATASAVASIIEGIAAGEGKTSVGEAVAAITEETRLGELMQYIADNEAAIVEGLNLGESWAGAATALAIFNEEVRLGATTQAAATTAGAFLEEFRVAATFSATSQGEETGSISEEARVGDTASAIATAVASISEESRLGDIIGGVISAARSSTEELRLGSTYTATSVAPRTITEEARLSDALSGVAASLASIAQGVNVGDTFIASVAGLTEAAVGEGSNLAAQFISTAIATAALSEELRVGASFAPTLHDSSTEQVNLAMAVTTLLQGAGSWAETATFGDIWAASAVASAAIIQGINVGDTFAGSATNTGHVTATLAIALAVTSTLSLERSITGTLTIEEGSGGTIKLNDP